MTMRGTYPDSPSGRFKVIDSIPTSHAYCITPKHVRIASDDHGGMLDESAIEDAERRGAKCGTCKGKLAYKEHESALLVECAIEPKEAEQEIKDWLKALAPEGEKNGYAGFAFIRAKNFVESPG